MDEQKISYGSTSSPAISHVNHKAQFEEIMAALQHNAGPSVTGEEGLKALRIILGIYESSEKGRWVDLT